jgi:hypothetical protein
MSVTFALRSVVSEDEFLNVSNSNARDILAVMGIPTDDDLYGSAKAKDFEVLARRAMMRLGFDPELSARTSQNPGACLVIHCGRPEGYIRGKLLALVEICQARISDEDEIAWG